MESYDREKGGLKHYTFHRHCWKLNPSQVDSRSHGKKPVSNIGLIPLLLENDHAAALLNRVMNLAKEAVEHLNPNQTPVLMMDQPLI